MQYRIRKTNTGYDLQIGVNKEGTVFVNMREFKTAYDAVHFVQEEIVSYQYNTIGHKFGWTYAMYDVNGNECYTNEKAAYFVEYNSAKRAFCLVNTMFINANLKEVVKQIKWQAKNETDILMEI